MIEYTVKVWPNGSKSWYLNGNLHREDGPAVEYPDGSKQWYLNDEQVTEEEHRQRTQPICDGKTVEIDGKTYVLTLKEN